MSHPNPFTPHAQQHALVAIPGKRNGYIMLAPAQAITTYADLPMEVLIAAKAWASLLESRYQSPRVYWITLSEVTRHLHIHLYPRWACDTQQGIPLFEARERDPQPDWNAELISRLIQWTEQYDVGLPAEWIEAQQRKLRLGPV